MRPPRGLTAAEEAAWAQLVSSVKPFKGRVRPKIVGQEGGRQENPAPHKKSLVPKMKRGLQQAARAPTWAAEEAPVGQPSKPPTKQEFRQALNQSGNQSVHQSAGHSLEQKGAARRNVKAPSSRLFVSQPPPALPPAKMTRKIAHTNLDSQWEKKLKSGAIAPDFTLDLHGHYVDAAHSRLDSGLHQARAMGARLVLVIAGRSRPVEAADRGENRGVIRAKLLDWLAVGDHADAIAAIRKAHRRHGGEGALYIVLRRDR